MREFPLSKREFESIYSKVPKLCAEVVIVVDGDHPSRNASEGQGVLLAKRQSNGWEGKWYLPGVGVYYRESVRDACVRLGREELGIELEIVKFLDYVEFWSEEVERGFGYSVALDFWCRTGDLIPQESLEGEEIKIFDKIPDNCVDEHKEILRRFFEGKFDE